MKNQVLHRPQLKCKITKIDLAQIIQSLIGNRRLGKFINSYNFWIINFFLGFEIDNLPNKEYLSNILHVLNPNHECFTGIQAAERLIPIPLSFLERMNFLDPITSNSNKRNKVFKLSEEERTMKSLDKIRKRRERKIRRRNYIQENLRKLVRGIEGL